MFLVQNGQVQTLEVDCSTIFTQTLKTKVIVVISRSKLTNFCQKIFWVYLEVLDPIADPLLIMQNRFLFLAKSDAPISVDFEAGEAIHTENSYKFDRPQIESFLEQCDLTIERQYTDSQRWFSVFLIAPA